MDERGFTLVEMLVAVTVLAIAMAAILAGMARYADNAARLRERTIALWVAHNRLTEIALQPTWPDLGRSDGEMHMAGRTWKWEVEVKKPKMPICAASTSASPHRRARAMPRACRPSSPTRGVNDVSASDANRR